ncbi:helix-turn-helix transcriptional regulator [Streptomyces sp. NPDC002640]
MAAPPRRSRPSRAAPLGLSQERLAHAAGLGVRTVIRLESGRHAVGIDALYAVAHALSVPGAVLVARTGPQP